MHRDNGRYVLSATDLARFAGCRHQTALEMARADGVLRRPSFPPDALLDALIERGHEHERAYVERLRAEGRTVVSFAGPGNDDDIAATVAAMTRGADVIVQAALGGDGWVGRPDILLRVDGE